MHVPWLIYIKERFPLPVYLLLSVGMAWQAQFALVARPEVSAMVLGPVLILIFFFCLRLMDEVKDYQKDLVAHPERPLPRGLVKKTTAQRLIWYVLGLQVLAGFVLLLGPHTAAGYWWLLTTIWLYLMYVEFFCGSWLEKRPFFYAVTHQLIIVPIVLAIAHIASSGSSEAALYSALMILGAFFSYEIGRKLDPKAHPILRSYRSCYGRWGALRLMLITSALAIGGTLLKMQGSLLASWPYILAAVLTLSLSAVWGESKPKLAETVASLSLILHIWGPIIPALFLLW